MKVLGLGVVLAVVSPLWATLLPRLGQDAITILQKDLFETVDDLWTDLKDPEWLEALKRTAQNANKKGEVDLAEDVLQGATEFGTKLDDVEKNLKVNAIKSDSSVHLFLEPLWVWAQVQEHLLTVDGLYKSFRALNKKDNSTEERQQWSDMANTVLKNSRASIPLAMDSLHKYATMEDGGGLFKSVSRALQESGTSVCGLEQSPQQLIYSLYNLVALTELKGYAMMQFSWMILRQYEKGNFTVEAELMQKRTEQRALEKAMAARDAMVGASRLVWRCDPKKHEETTTFVQLTELLQGQIQNEVDLNSQNSCRENCAYYTYAKVHGCYHNQYCSKQRTCKGRLFNCQYIDSDAWVCGSDSANRRYDWIEYENGRVLGKRNSCSRGSTKVDSWWRWLFWHCSYCFCMCDEQGPNSDRYFSLRQVIADVSAGRVITGLRFVKIKRVVHIQIQEGKVLPRGTIDENSLRWRPVDSFRVENAAPGVDYHTMTWEQRAMDLDDLVAPDGYVLTGIRFRRIGLHLNPEILATPLNITTGHLKHEGSLWLGNENTDAAITEPRTEIKLRQPDVPTRSPMPSEPDSTHDQFVLFGNSDMNKDAAQTTVPFLDAQSVAPSPPVLLAGAGIYHKGRSGYGGFVGLRLVTYDFTNHLGIGLDTTKEKLLPQSDDPNIVNIDSSE